MSAIARSIDKMLVLFPFEEALYQRRGRSGRLRRAPAGRPDLRRGRDRRRTRAAAAVRGAQDRRAAAGQPAVGAALHGAAASSETAKLIAARQPAVHFLVPLISRETRAIFEEALYAARRVGSAADRALSGTRARRSRPATCALVASGTATLETALARKPMVITYKMAGAHRPPHGEDGDICPAWGCPISSPASSWCRRSCRTTRRPRTWRRRC